MKPTSRTPSFSRPSISDAFGPISGFDSFRFDASRGLKERALILARKQGFNSTGSWIRSIVEREVIAANVPTPGQTFRTENGLTQIVHEVKRK